MKSLLPVFFLFLITATSYAETCTANITRTCQPGKPCRTSETRTEAVSASSDCARFAKAQCSVYFSDAVLRKEVRARFGHQSVEGGQNLCR